MGTRVPVGRRDNRPRLSNLLLLMLLSSLTTVGFQSGIGRGVAHAQVIAGSFKIAFWNIHSGNGERPLPGRSCGFTENGNCTDASRPLNAWGMHVVQDELVRSIKNDPSVVALGLAETWSCATALTARPGAAKNDSTIVPLPQAP